MSVPILSEGAFSMREEDLRSWFDNKEFHKMTVEFISFFEHFRDKTYLGLTEREKSELNRSVLVFFFYMSNEDFMLGGEKNIVSLIKLNYTISNVVAISDFGTTDAVLRILVNQKSNFAKLLVLYSARNFIKLDYRKLFEANSSLSSLWYFCFLEMHRTGPSDALALRNLNEHIDFDDDRIIGINEFMNCAYFGSTYINHQNDDSVKRRVNSIIQSLPVANKRFYFNKSAGARSIVVATAMWKPLHSVYRSQQPFMEELAKNYRLILVKLGDDTSNIDSSLFSDVRHYSLKKGDDFSAFDIGDFSAVYFPDVGMSMESIVLANLRISDVQIANYGHPVSTYGAKIDYWIGGKETEIPSLSTRHYSEKLILIDGCGQAPVPLCYEPCKPRLSPNKIIINCAWTAQKIHFNHLSNLREILSRSGRGVVFRFYPAGFTGQNGFIPLKRSIQEILGEESVEIYPNLSQFDYLKSLETAHFALDSFPFGGYNTAIDLLTLRIPIVCLEGTKFFNKSTPYLLRKIGLSELVASCAQEFIDKSIRMISDDVYRDSIRRTLEQVDLFETVLCKKDVRSFVKAIDCILLNSGDPDFARSRVPYFIH